MKEFAKFVGIMGAVMIGAYVLNAGLTVTGAYGVLVWLPLAFLGALIVVPVGRALVDHLRRR